MGWRDRSLLAAVVASAFVSGCYSGSRATRDANQAWRGQSGASIKAQWGSPASVSADGDITTLQWSLTNRHYTLPTVKASLVVQGDEFEAEAELRPGSITETQTLVTAHLDVNDVIVSVRGPSLRWGAPHGANIRWGLLMGLHAGMGRLDDTSTALPGGGMYIGGMLARTVGLVGSFSLVSGTDDEGAAMGFVWGLSPQWWPTARTWLRAGPALILAFDPGFEDIGVEPGLTGGASYAIVRSGAFVLDVRLDLTAGPSTVLGVVGVGVNRN